MVARIVPSVYNGDVIMCTNTRIMSIRERSNLSSTTLPDFELRPGLPDGFISVKLPRTNLDYEELFVHRRVAFRKGGTLTVGGAYLWDLALLFWKDAPQKMKDVQGRSTRSDFGLVSNI